MKWFVNARAKLPVRRQDRFRPRVEELENRLTPSSLTPLDVAAQPVAVAPVALSQDLVLPLITPQATSASARYVTGAMQGGTTEGVAVGADGSVYMAGQFKDTNIYQDQVAYVTKLSPTGQIVYASAFRAFTDAGSTAEFTGIAVDSAGNAYASGKAHHSTDGADIGLALKLDPTGANVVYYWGLPGGNSGGPAPAGANGVATDAAGDGVFVLAYNSTTTETDVAILRLNPSGSGTYYFVYPFTATDGGRANAVAMPASGATTTVVGAITPTGSSPNSFVMNVDATGNVTVSTYFPDSTTDAFNAVALDSAGNIFMGGTVDIGGLTQHGVALETDAGLTTLIWATSPISTAASVNGIALTAAGDVIVTGGDASGKAYIAQLSGVDGSGVDYTVFGGTGGSDVGQAVAVRGSDGHIFDVGTTNSSDFPVTDGSTLLGPTDGFLTEWTIP